jgi:cytochrome c5
MSLRSIILVLALVFAFMYVLVACVMNRADEAAQNKPIQQETAKATEPRLIADPTAVPELADAPGRDAFIANCLNCHSARYVLMQPRFNRKVWTAEVAKMVSAYKAPIPAEQQPKIVDYLVAGYGTADQ